MYSQHLLLLRNPYFPKCVFRCYSASPTIDPKSKATKMLDRISESSIISKTGKITVGIGLIAFILSKELIIFNPETVLLACFSGVGYILYKKYSGTIGTELNNYADQFRKKLSQSYEAKKAFLEDEIQKTA